MYRMVCDLQAQLVGCGKDNTKIPVQWPDRTADSSDRQAFELGASLTFCARIRAASRIGRHEVTSNGTPDMADSLCVGRDTVGVSCDGGDERRLRGTRWG